MGCALAAPRHATALDRPVGQWLTNIRRPGGLGKDADRAERRDAQLSAADPDWNPAALGWSVDWQRHHVGLAALLDEGALLTDIVPGVTARGQHRALAPPPAARPRQAQRRAAESDSLNSVCAHLYRPARHRCPAPRRLAGRDTEAFTRGLAALTQYVQREQRTVIPRQHTEHITIDGQDHDVRLGMWVSNQNSSRDKLNEQQLANLAELGMDWA
ncbi:helicase associated domain-containing protein [Streptomyces sp. HUAS TT7]|uniref:helicase associated domain-containing protein n=1 Tax=Streptomyces sp. HUAS TT7 TaxID=3447507 RepID=UPI003F65D0F4